MRISFENSTGEKADFSSGFIRAVKAEGITPYSTVNYAESAFFDGAEYISEYVQTRKIVITAVVCGKDEGHILGLSSVVGADGGGRLIFETGGKSMEIFCYTENSDIVYESTPAKIKLTFICLSPFFERTDSAGGRYSLICGTDGKLEFEWELFERDNILSETVGSRSVLIENRGSVSSGCVITVDVLRNTSDIRIVNASAGKYIEMSGSWDSGSRLVIDTRSGRKGVYCYYPDGSSEDVIYRLKWGSDFFSLPAGVCRIYADSSDGNSCLSAVIFFNERYRGIV